MTPRFFILTMPRQSPFAALRNASRPFAFVLILLTSSGIAIAAEDDRAEFFERYVRPVLLDRCVECHGPVKQEAEIRFDRRDVLLKSSGDQALVKPTAPDESRMIQVLAHSEDDVQMPPTNKLPDDQIGNLRKWITDGAFWPESSDLESEARRRAEKWRTHWSFQRPVKPDLSAVETDQNPVDYLIRKQLAASGLPCSQPAEPRSIVRRLSYALVGLPPEFKDLNDIAAAAVESEQAQATQIAAYIDRLLASPHFGERWGRYWLDVSRYADTKGYVFQEDREYSEAWRFREWVIRSLNEDMPYDEFLKRQLAADRMSGSDDPAQLAAMGFLTLGRRFLNNNNDIIDDRIDVTIRGMNGLTASCARCHDHKFDPIPTADYYSLYGIFESSDEPKNEPSPLRLVDREKPTRSAIFVRGQPGNRGEVVPRRFLSALSGADAPEFTDGSGRVELAAAIASPENPLTARVAANRAWMHLFGRGLVESPSDFGVRTPPPANPELLDYLATGLMENGWSRKWLIRQIVSSRTFQQSSAERSDASQVDPENLLLARQNRRRLDFEALRDSLLAAAGTLDLTVGGPSVDITAENPGRRRTIYARIDRQNLPGVFRTFDLANPDAHAPKRFETTVPQQALFQLNSPFVMDLATAAADSAKSETAEISGQVATLFRRILRREGSAEELSAAAEFLTWSETQDSNGDGSGWSYGFGSVDASGDRIGSFTALPRFERGSWQGGRKMPDPTIGWASLNRSGGHPGNDAAHCTIRRWTTDVDCRVSIVSQASHGSSHGDGIQARILKSHGGIVATANLHDAKMALDVAAVSLQAGESLDFVVDCRADPGFDSFLWQIQMTQTIGNAEPRTWDSEKDFGRSQSSRPSGAMAQLAQALMMTNEFVFID